MGRKGALSPWRDSSCFARRKGPRPGAETERHEQRFESTQLVRFRKQMLFRCGERKTEDTALVDVALYPDFPVELFHYALNNRKPKTVAT